MMRWNLEQLKQLDQHAKSRQFTSEDYQLLSTLLSSYQEFLNLLKDPATTQEDLDRYLDRYEQDTATEAARRERNQSPPQDRLK